MARVTEDVIETYLRYVSSKSEAPRQYHIWSIITAIGAAMERRCWVDREAAGNVYPNLYTILVGPQGDRKTTATNNAISLLREVKPCANGRRIHFCADTLTPAVLWKSMYKAESEFEVNFEKIPQSHLFVYAPEWAAYSQDIGGGELMPDMTKFWDPGERDPKKYVVTKETISAGQLRLRNPGITMLACTTSAFLEAATPMLALGFGIVGRSLYIVNKDPIQPIAHPEFGDLSLRKPVIETLDHIHKNLTGPFTWEPAARKDFEDWYVPFKRESQGVGDIFRAGYYSRKDLQVIKVAMILSASTRDTMTISQHDLASALAYLSVAEQTMFSAFGAKGQYQRAGIVKKISDLIPVEPLSVKHSEIIHALRYDTNDDDLRKDIRSLYSMGAIKTFIDPQNPQEPIYSRNKDFNFDLGLKRLKYLERRLDTRKEVGVP